MSETRGRPSPSGRPRSAHGSKDGLGFNLLEQLTFYGAYHNNPWNQLIHFVFVPVILGTILVWLRQLGPLPVAPLANHMPHWVPSLMRDALQPDVGFLVFLAYSGFYMLLDGVAGFTWTCFVGLPLWWGAAVMAHALPAAWAYCIPLHVFAWYMQIHPGHAVLEKRKPALMDSLVQAFALAPLFVWFELLFLVGYRPGLRKQLKARVDEEIRRAKKQQ